MSNNLPKHKSPLQTIRSFCIACVCGHSKEVASCDGDGIIPGFMQCHFHPYRLGKGRPSVKIMRKFCLQCQGGSSIMVKECTTEDCLIHPYRFGKNPALEGKGRSAAQMASIRSYKQAVSNGNPVYFARLLKEQSITQEINIRRSMNE